MSTLKQLRDEQGQAVWLDFVARGFIEKGELAKLVREDGLSGVTSNPSIFEKAIGHSAEYDDGLKLAEGAGDRSITDLYETLAIDDIRHVADVLRPVYDETKGADGFVSLEVSPYLALNPDKTREEARRLWKAVERDNVMIKVPATAPGIDVIRDLTADGINVNITLLFSQAMYERVANAYIEGLERLAKNGGGIDRIASVASFFVSRIDVAADKALDAKIAAANDPAHKAALEQLKGRVAIANAKLAYRKFEKLFSGPRWDALSAKGAHVQRLLWASTGTKSKAYSDVLYIEELIGPKTVNTIPPATMDAFRDHGRVRASLQSGLPEAEKTLADLARAGISLDEITQQVLDEGVALFVDAADKLYGAVAGKRAKILAGQLDQQTIALPAELQKPFDAAIESLRADRATARLWDKDAKVWTNHDEAKWLGWLDIVDRELANLAEYEAFASEVRRDGFTDVLLLGMGGSSLGPEVLGEIIGSAKGAPRLHILDSTDPAQIRATEAAIDLKKTLFIVSSKSGSTLEPNIFKDYFFARAKEVLGDKAADHFVAVTDPGSAMEKAARIQGFRRIFFGDPAIGGRYSVLSAFGLVPAAAIGADLARFLTLTRLMMRSCGADAPPAVNPGILLGTAFGVAARAGRDKVTVLASPKLADFGAWAEQLIAESTGKEGKGLVPVADEPLGAPGVYGVDRIFVYLSLVGDRDAAQDSSIEAIENAGHPVVRIEVKSAEHLGQEFFRWEIATAIAGSLIGINPFDQPDVEASKIKTRELTDAYEKAGALPAEKPVFARDGIDLYCDGKNADALRRGGAGDDFASWIKAHLDRAGAGDYVALLAYIQRDTAHVDALRKMRVAIRDARHVATCVGFGPRFLHSTGQAYKGGPNSGVFLQVTTAHPDDLAIPNYRAGFGIVEAAQARGDMGVLVERDRRVLRVHFADGNVEGGLKQLAGAVERATH
ncbi:MAG: bifunctional transaldolase/phosoglucose isomerase [Beijerinckiaceae bacterium]